MKPGAAPLDGATRAAISAAWGLSPHAEFETLGTGLINRTLHVRDDARERVLQRLNTEIFRSPETVMRNCHAVTAHLGRERVRALRAGGMSSRDAASMVAEELGVPKRLAYRLAQESGVEESTE